MDIKTMSVNTDDLSISINGEGHICAPDYFPQVDSNIASLHWHPERQGRCKGSISRHTGGGEGINEFTLLQPFVKAWEEAKERKQARTALEQAEALGVFGSPEPMDMDPDPLPRFLAQQQPVAPDMQARYEDFEKRVAEELANRSVPQDQGLADRVTRLEGVVREILTEFKNLRRGE